MFLLDFSFGTKQRCYPLLAEQHLCWRPVLFYETYPSSSLLSREAHESVRLISCDEVTRSAVLDADSQSRLVGG